MWHPYRNSRVFLVEHPDGTFSARSVIFSTTLPGSQDHQREVGIGARGRQFNSKDEAAADALDSLGL